MIFFVASLLIVGGIGVFIIGTWSYTVSKYVKND